MAHPRIPRRLAAAAVVGLAATAGCTHNHYYGNAIPVCEAPGSAPFVASAPVVAYGSVCDVPPRAAIDSPPIVADAGRAGPIITRRAPARVVVSEPATTPRISASAPRLGWRGRMDDRGATTRIVGAFDDVETR